MGMGRQRRLLLETALLVSLLEEEGHGYALVERVEQLVREEICVDPGSVYRSLRSLEEAGMVSSSWDTGAGGPARRTYRVTPAGRELLKSWAAFLAHRGRAFQDLAALAESRLATS